MIYRFPPTKRHEAKVRELEKVAKGALKLGEFKAIFSYALVWPSECMEEDVTLGIPAFSIYFSNGDYHQEKLVKLTISDKKFQKVLSKINQAIEKVRK